MQQLDRQVEEARIRETMLRSLYTNPSAFAGSLSHDPALTIIKQDMNYQGSTCICRVPKAQVKAGTVVECVHCGERLPLDPMNWEQVLMSRQDVAAAAPTHEPRLQYERPVCL